MFAQAAPHQPGPRQRKLPRLRANLQFMRGAPTPDGVPTWTIVDPVRNRYFQIEWPAYQMIQRWETGTIERLHDVLAGDTTCRITVDDVEDLVKFLYANNLTEQSAGGTHRDFEAQAGAGTQHWLMWLVHHYLFIKIPLVHPHGFLKATLPLVAPLYTAVAAWFVGSLGLVGLIMVSRQWDTFVSTFLYFFNWKGAAIYSLSLCAVKIVHELGHAYTATRFGCRVPTIGIAFMVMMPVLYSDVSDSYRLTSKRKRLGIAAAGVVAEIGLACLASFLWGFLPDGTMRSIAFVVATTSLLMSLAVNLNPLMRFDGYYLLADGLGMPNLQDRAFAFGQWRLRKLLFGDLAAPPERTSSGMERILVSYAWAIWLYRLILFTGIAVMVYHLFFKALGIILFLVEIVWFVALPIIREVTGWWNNRTVYAATPRAWISALTFSVLCSLAFIPARTSVSLPAVLQASSHAAVFSPETGQIQEVLARHGQHVDAGDRIAVLSSPALEHEIRLAEIKSDVLAFRLDRRAGHAGDLAQSQVLTESLNAGLTELAGLEEKQEQLILKAPISGVIRDLEGSLVPGRWIDGNVQVALVVDPTQVEIEGMVPVTELAYLSAGQPARFIPLDLTRTAVNARVRDIREIDEGEFSISYLASVYGGDVPVRRDDKGRLKPDVSVYRVRLAVSESSGVEQAVVGRVRIEGPPSSLARRAWDQVAAVLIRESGF